MLMGVAVCARGRSAVSRLRNLVERGCYNFYDFKLEAEDAFSHAGRERCGALDPSLGSRVLGSGVRCPMPSGLCTS